MVKVKKFLKLSARSLLSFVLVLTLSANSTILAMSDEQRRLYDLGIYLYDIEENNICSNRVVNGSVDRFLQVLAFQESGGRITAEASGSTASGKYQYIDSTWKSRASIYGPAGNYSRAKDAPEEVQDAVAYIEYTKAFKDLDNDLFKLAINHFYPAANSDSSHLDRIIGSNVITPRQYADKLISNIGKGVALDIPLKYSSAPEFDEWLSKSGGAPPTVSDSSTPISNSGSCNGSSMGTRSKVVDIVKRELGGGAKESDNTYLKYTNNREAQWCAYFVSWVFREAGAPFDPDPQSTALGILDIAKSKGKFYAKDSGYEPKPGDIAIYKENRDPYPSHVNIVIDYNPSTKKYTSIGGNESDTIKQATIDISSVSLTGFMNID